MTIIYHLLNVTDLNFTRTVLHIKVGYIVVRERAVVILETRTKAEDGKLQLLSRNFVKWERGPFVDEFGDVIADLDSKGREEKAKD